ncbi:DNA-entry nuclease, partial [Lacticaseibacillus paracasei subsp. paracasei Lpp123]
MRKNKLLQLFMPLAVVVLLLGGCSTTNSRSVKSAGDPVASQTKANKKTQSAISSLDSELTE